MVLKCPQQGARNVRTSLHGPVLQPGRAGGAPTCCCPPSLWVFPSARPQGDAKMMEILKFTHQFLQKFCAGNQENQALLHKHLNLFLTPGVRRGNPRVAQGEPSAPALGLRARDPSEGSLGEEGAGQEGRLLLTAPQA